MVKEYQSEYQEIWTSLPHPQDVKIVVEVGMNDGDGALKLKDYFPSAHVFTFERPIRTPDYNTPLEDILKKLDKKATVVLEESPLPYDWGHPYDVCTIDIGSNPETNFENVKYWLKFKKPGGVLAALIPKGTEEKREKKKIFLKKLEQTNWSYKEIYYNWFIFT